MLMFGCAGAQGTPAAPAKANAQTPSPAAQAPTPAPAAPATTPATAPTTAPATTPAAAPEKVAATGTGFADYMGMRSTSKWKIEYDVSTGGATTIPMTQYTRGNDIRTDTAVGGQTTRAYLLGTKYYSCMEQAGAWTCFEFGMPAGSAQSKIETEPSKYAAVADGTMQVAGTTANCFKLNVEGTAMRYCFSKEGVPLYLSSSGTANGQKVDTIMTARSYTLSVSDSDFELPAASQAMPSLPSYGG